MTTLSNSFEGGSDETTITTGNSGGSSGDAFDDVLNAIFDSAQAAHGSLSCRYDLAAASTAQTVWMTTGSTWYARMYVYLTSAPPANMQLITPQSSTTIRLMVRIMTDRTVQITSSGFANLGQSTTVLATGQWYRIECEIIEGTTTAGLCTVRIYTTPDGTTADETLVATSTTVSAWDRLRFGACFSAGQTYDMWADDLGASDVDWLGPATGEAHSGSATITGALTMAATGTPDVDGSADITGTLAVTATGTPSIDGSGTLGGTLTMTARGTADMGIGLPPRPRTRWQLVTGPASGGHELALTEATSRRYTARLNEGSDLSFSIDGRHAQAEQIEELQTDVHLLYSDADGTQILDRCRVGPTGDDIDADAHRVEVTCLDYRAMLARRILYAADTLTYAATDQAEIAWGLVDTTQSRDGGALGIAKGWTGTTPTGVTRDRTYEAGDSIGQRIQELSEVIDGFDWDIVPVSASGLRLDVWHPQRGSDRGVVLILGGLAAAVRREVDPSGYANALRYTGAEGLTAAELQALDLADSTVYPQGRWDAAHGDDGLTTQAALDARAAWQLAESQAVTPVYTVRLRRGGWDGPGHIWLGDTVRLIIPSGRLDVDTTARVHEVQIDMDGDRGETVTLTLGGRRPDFRRWPSRVDQRLRDLERR